VIFHIGIGCSQHIRFDNHDGVVDNFIGLPLRQKLIIASKRMRKKCLRILVIQRFSEL